MKLSRQPIDEQDTVPLIESRPGLSIFWRTFILVMVLLTCSVLLWVTTWHNHLALSAQTNHTQGNWVYVWIGVASLFTIIGAAIISKLVNQPLQRLSFATSMLREGHYSATRLDETGYTSEIREVNAGFNRMAEQLAKVEQDRAIMLAGISHDLRTPLARLRLDLEMSVPDAQARELMAADIDQADAIIDKFLDYAKPGNTQLQPVNVLEVLNSCLARETNTPGLNVALQADPSHFIMGDRVELSRVMTNLIENARKYGQSPNGETFLEITVIAHKNQIYIRFRDYGKGVSPAMLHQLTQPFFRADSARTHATGAGLGLAIIDKIITRMGGTLSMSNADDGGLVCRIRLVQAKEKSGYVASRVVSTQFS